MSTVDSFSVVNGWSYPSTAFIEWILLQRSSSSGRDVGKLVCSAELLGNGGSVTTTNDDGVAGLCALNTGFKHTLGTLGESLKLKHTRRSVPDDGLGLGNGVGVQLGGLLAVVQTLQVVGDSFLQSGVTDLGIWREVVSSDEINRQNDLDVVLLSLLNQLWNDLSTLLVKQRLTNVHFVDDLVEGEGHTTTNDQDIDLLKQVVNQLDLVRHLGTSQDSQEWSDWVLQSLGEALTLPSEVFLEPSSSMWNLKFSKRNTSPSEAPLTADSTSGPTESFKKFTFWPKRDSNSVATGFKVYLRLTSPFGLPKCEARTTAFGL
ncbi:hypothetical protein OGAPHI_000016 [Ogataea philodendri]|uniref:Uncharacterized protein n=1 Tax=Ogataea philodendri TaxID=1378263 RepID=A0A9P8PHX2_9ASCO|nr:uncharacterized protein OGAPHI_000016 [Ogataea philodendri]KAH3671830.1 hypothetical protein OGAPHI_000016 [Ogataea philodendri]